MEKQVDFLTLFRDAGRHAYYETATRREPFFEPSIRAWIVTEPDQAKDFLTSPDILMPPYESEIERISDRFSIDLEAIGYAFRHAPLSNNGDSHESLRRRMGEFLVGRKPTTERWFKNDLQGLLKPFFKPGSMEAMSEVIEPIVGGLLGTLIDVDGILQPKHETPTLIFDRSLGLSKRQRINLEISSLRRQVRERLGPGASEEDVGVRVVVLVIGKEPTGGTIAQSLIDIFSTNQGERLSDIAFPQGPVATGVPHVERVVGKSFEYAGQQFIAGQTVRVVLQSVEYGDGEIASHRFFGAGAHACLGRPVSMTLWRAITAILSTSTLRVRLVSSVPKTDNFAFAYPAALNLELSE